MSGIPQSFSFLFEVASVLVFVNSMFVPWAMLFDRRYEIDPDGICVRARISPGRIPWQSFRWVRVVASTGAASPRITFWLASRRGGIALTVDASAGAEAADRVASAVARYAPGLRRKGFTDCVKWDRAGPVDGEFVFQDDSFGELGIMFAFAGAMAAVSMQLAPLLGPEIVPAKIVRAAVGLAYFVLVVVYISAANRMVSTDARSEPRRISPRARPFARFGGAAMMALSAVAALLAA